MNTAENFSPSTREILVLSDKRNGRTLITEIAAEMYLPFVLPLRSGCEGFTVEAHLHNLRCPLLAIASERAATKVPNVVRSTALRARAAWRVALSGPIESQIEELGDTVITFQDTLAKCPQKNKEVS